MNLGLSTIDNLRMRNSNKEDLKQAFSERFKLALKEAGINGSLREVGAILGVSKSFVDDLYKANALPTRERSLKIAAICGVRESWLMTGEGPMREPITNKISIEHWDESDRAALLKVWESIESKYNK